jgi:hypothetical protein
MKGQVKKGRLKIPLSLVFCIINIEICVDLSQRTTYQRCVFSFSQKNETRFDSVAPEKKKVCDIYNQPNSRLSYFKIFFNDK